MHFARCDANLRAHTKLTPIGKLGGRIVKQNCRVDFTKKPLNHLRVFGNYAFRVVR